MKTIRNAALFCLLTVQAAFFSQTRSDIFEDQNIEITWLGIDFTRCSYFGDPGTVSSVEMKELFNRINSLVASEQEKYDFRKAFRKKKVSYNITATLEKNTSIDDTKIITFNDKELKTLSDAEVRKIVKAYDFEDQSGIGLMFIMEGLNKAREAGYMWVTFINIETKEVLFTERVIGTASGFGFRNHWAGTVHSVIVKIEEQLFKKWKNG